MKAVICTKYGSPEVLQLKEVAKPIPRDHEVLVKIHATTVTAADCRVRSFNIPASFWLPARVLLGLSKPRKNILGVELAGEVESVGKNVRRFKKGDHIFAATLTDFGAYAEYKCLPEDGPIVLKPSSITFEEAATIPIGARTALYYLQKANIKKDQRILIYGASGSVGTYAVQLAKYFGAHVSAVCSSANQEFVTALGADQIIDYSAKSFAETLGKYDVIFVAVDKCPFSLLNKTLANGGVFLNVSTPLKSLPMFWTSISSKKKIIVGENPPESAEALLFLKTLVDTGILKPVIDRIYTIEQIVEAHQYVDKGHKKGNVAVKVIPA